MKQYLPTPFDLFSLYLTTEHNCPYIPGKTSKDLYVDIWEKLDAKSYQYLLAQGFRRSGNYTYRPCCDTCSACLSVRIPVQQFQPRRSQRRCWQRNIGEFNSRIRPLDFYPDHYELYKCYTAKRHADGDISDVSERAFKDFIFNNFCNTVLIELFFQDHLSAVAVTDVLPHSLSAVYTFFDPAFDYKSLGVFSILWQIEEAKRRGLKHLYLGYWIKECRKMSYKNQYQPLEVWNGREWLTYAGNFDTQTQNPE